MSKILEKAKPYLLAPLLAFVFGCADDVLCQTPVPLVLGQRVEREIKGGEAHPYSFELAIEDYVEFSVEQRGIDTRASIFNDRGGTVANVNDSIDTDVAVVVAESKGLHILVVRATTGTATGTYTLTWRTVRPATVIDKKRNAADRTLEAFSSVYQTQDPVAIREFLKKLSEARDYYKTVGNSSKEGRAWGHMGSSYYALGDRPRAIEHYTRGLEFARSLGDRRDQCVALGAIGTVNAEIGNIETAIEKLTNSLEPCAEYDDGLASALNNLGRLWDGLGNGEKATEYFFRALEKNPGDRRHQGIVLNNIAIAMAGMGQRQGALDYYSQSLIHRKAVGDKRGEGTTLNNIGALYRDLGEWQTALDMYDQALSIHRTVGNVVGAGDTLNNMALVFSNLGKEEEALKIYGEVLTVRRQTNSKRGEAITHLGIGSTYAKLAKHQLALENFMSGLNIAREVGDRRTEAIALNNIGLHYITTGDRSKANEYLLMSLALRRATTDSNGEADSLSNLADNARLQGKSNFAILLDKQAVRLYESLRTDIRAIDRGAQKSFLRMIERKYRTLALVLIKQDRLAEALQVLNLFKDQQYFDFNRDFLRPKLYLTAREAALSTGFDKRVSAVASAIVRVDSIKRTIGANQPSSQQSIDFKTAQDALSMANAEYLAFMSASDAEMNSSHDPTTSPLPVGDLADIRLMLQNEPGTTRNTVALYALLGEENCSLLFVTKDDIGAVALQIKGQDLKRKLSNFASQLRSPRYDPRPLAKELYDIVFKPIESKLPKGTKTILWSLDGSLRYIPIGAFYDGEKYLIERYSNVVFTRADTERMLRARSPYMSGIGLGSSEEHVVELAGMKFQASALPAVKIEISSIFRNAVWPGVLSGDVLLDRDFTKESMLSILKKNRSIVHIASHFKFEPGDEARSFLVMGDGTPFTLDQMKKEKDMFKGVDLLTLSACQTAVQRPDANGREVDGFAELAQRLGAGAVMASLWEVSDDSTAELMSRFYKGYVTGGLNKADAIRQAQLALLNGEYKTAPTVQRQLTQNDKDVESIKIDPAKLIPYKPKKTAPYAHPFYWSPFVLIGNWK